MKRYATLLTGFLLAGFTLNASAVAFAQTTADNTTLEFALVFSRHGVRPPTKTNDNVCVTKLS